mgnify:CR=1 FL=1
MNEPPVMISTKDLAYISDMFEWNYGAFKSVSNITTKDANIKKILNKCTKICKQNMEGILTILKDGKANE